MSDGDGDGVGMGLYVTRVEFMEYKEHQDTRYNILCEKIEEQGKTTKGAITLVGAIISILTLMNIVLSYFGVI